MFLILLKIYNFILSIPKDKLLHIVAEMLITMLAILVFKLCGCGKDSCAYGWAVGCVFGIVKEIIDEKKRKNSEAADWAFDIVAATLVSLYSLVLML